MFCSSFVSIVNFDFLDFGSSYAPHLLNFFFFLVKRNHLLTLLSHVHVLKLLEVVLDIGMITDLFPDNNNTGEFLSFSVQLEWKLDLGSWLDLSRVLVLYEETKMTDHSL